MVNSADARNSSVTGRPALFRRLPVDGVAAADVGAAFQARSSCRRCWPAARDTDAGCHHQIGDV